MTEMTASVPTDLPVLPLRDVVVFPSMVIPLFVGREKSIKALDRAMDADKRILLVAQKSPETDDPGAADLFEVGTLAQVLQLLKLPDGTIKVLVEGVSRAVVDGVRDEVLPDHPVGRRPADEERAGQEPELDRPDRAAHDPALGADRGGVVVRAGPPGTLADVGGPLAEDQARGDRDRDQQHRHDDHRLAGQVAIRLGHEGMMIEGDSAIRAAIGNHAIRAGIGRRVHQRAGETGIGEIMQPLGEKDGQIARLAETIDGEHDTRRRGRRRTAGIGRVDGQRHGQYSRTDHRP